MTRSESEMARIHELELEQARIRDLNEYLWDHLGETHTSTWLASRFGLSRVYVAERLAVVKRLGAEAFAVAVMVPPGQRVGHWVPPTRESDPPPLSDEERAARLREYLATTPRRARVTVAQMARDLKISQEFARRVIAEVEPLGRRNHDCPRTNRDRGHRR